MCGYSIGEPIMKEEEERQPLKLTKIIKETGIQKNVLVETPLRINYAIRANAQHNWGYLLYKLFSHKLTP